MVLSETTNRMTSFGKFVTMKCSICELINPVLKHDHNELYFVCR